MKISSKRVLVSRRRSRRGSRRRRSRRKERSGGIGTKWVDDDVLPQTNWGVTSYPIELTSYHNACLLPTILTNIFPAYVLPKYRLLPTILPTTFPSYVLAIKFTVYSPQYCPPYFLPMSCQSNFLSIAQHFAHHISCLCLANQISCLVPTIFPTFCQSNCTSETTAVHCTSYLRNNFWHSSGLTADQTDAVRGKLFLVNQFFSSAINLFASQVERQSWVTSGISLLLLTKC